MELASVQPILDWVKAHQDWAQVAVFSIAAAESLALVGILLPGIAFMLGIGALVGLGSMDLLNTLVSAALGAIVGDGISFWLGRRYHAQLKNLWPLTRYPQLIPRGEDFFYRHGGKSVLFGRFFGPVRAIIPAVAGMLDMPAWKFYSVNIVSAIAWAPAVILPGVAFGASLTLAAEVTTRLAVLLALVSLLLWLSFIAVKKSVGWFLPRSQNLLNTAHRWASNHTHIGPMINAVIDPKHLKLSNVLTLWASAILTTLALLACAILIKHNILYVYQQMSSPKTPVVLSREHWEERKLKQTTILHPDRPQTTVHGITLWWAGSEQDIIRTLRSSGWQAATKLTWQSALMMLNPDTDSRQLPVMPHVHNGYFPGLIQVLPHSDPDKLYVLRLWRSRFATEDEKPVWIGNITVSHINTDTHLLRFLTTVETLPDPTALLAPQDETIKSIAR